MFEVRVLGPLDVETLRGMLFLFGEAFDDRDHYTAKQRPYDYLRNAIPFAC